MIGVTLFGIFLTPVFFFVVRRLTRGVSTAPAAPQSDLRAADRDGRAGSAAPHLTMPSKDSVEKLPQG
jgi:hypothetical protein